MKPIETRKNRPWTLWVLAFLLAAPLASQTNNSGEEVGLRMDVDKRQVEVGDTLSLTIEFKQLMVGGSNVSAQPNFPTPELFQEGSSFNSTQVTIVNQKTAQTTTTHMNLVAVKPGSETLGPASVIFQDPSGKRQEIRSNVINVTVTEKKPFSLFGGSKPTSLPAVNPAPAQAPADEGLRDLKPLLPDPILFLLKLLIWIAILVLVGVLVWRITKPKKSAVKGPPPIGEEKRLRDIWKKLSDEDLSAEIFCRSLSSLVRECLQYHFEFDAVDLTTEEIFRELKKHELTSKEMEAVEKCLKACDRVLYADGNLTGRDTLRSLSSSLLPKVSNN